MLRDQNIKECEMKGTLRCQLERLIIMRARAAKVRPIPRRNQIVRSGTVCLFSDLTAENSFQRKPLYSF